MGKSQMLFLKRITSFLRAVWSFVIHGDERLIVYEDRQRICLNCDQLSVWETGVFCKACNCPRWALSDLRTKWRMRDLKCPQGKW